MISATRKGVRLAPLAAAFCFVSLLAGCGSASSSKPTPTVVATTSTAEATTVGQLADRMASAWAGVKTYRTSFSSLSQTAATPVAENETVVVDEVQMPDRKRRVNETAGGTTAELVVVGGVIYARGPLVPGVVAASSPETWLTIDPHAFAQGSNERRLYESLLAPIAPPYSGLDDQVRARSAVPIGTIDVQGQSCAGYRIADTTSTGDRIVVVLALGADDLPCAIETFVAGTDNLQLFTFNVPVQIEAPTGATPAIVASPMA